MRRIRWNNLTDTWKGALTGAAVVQFALLAAALLDLYRRPEDEVNGSKWLWRLVVFINFIGPIAYFLFGRREASGRRQPRQRRPIRPAASATRRAALKIRGRPAASGRSTAPWSTRPPSA